MNYNLSLYKKTNSNMRVFCSIHKENKRRYILKRKRIEKFLKIQYNNRIQQNKSSFTDYLKCLIESICMDLYNNNDDMINPDKINDFKLKIRSIKDSVI